MKRLLANGFVQKEMMALEQQLMQTEEHTVWTMKQRRPKLTSQRRKNYVPQKKAILPTAAYELMEDSEWRRLKTCCGYVMENRELSAVIINTSTMSICNEHKFGETRIVPKVPTLAPTTALKKHHLYLNRALLNGDLQYASPIPAILTPSEVVAIQKAANPVVAATAPTGLLDLSEKLAELSNGLVQRVQENNKFSDNSSDSGYEELSSVPEVVSF